MPHFPFRILALLAAALALTTAPPTHAQPAHNAEGPMQVISPEVTHGFILRPAAWWTAFRSQYLKRDEAIFSELEH